MMTISYVSFMFGMDISEIALTLASESTPMNNNMMHGLDGFLKYLHPCPGKHCTGRVNQFMPFIFLQKLLSGSMILLTITLELTRVFKLLCPGEQTFGKIFEIELLPMFW